jgi:hypothetical protein
MGVCRAGLFRDGFVDEALRRFRVRGRGCGGLLRQRDAELAISSGTGIGHAKPQEAVVVGDTPYDVIRRRKGGHTHHGLLSGGFTEEDLRSAGAVEIYKDVARWFPQSLYLAFIILLSGIASGDSGRGVSLELVFPRTPGESPAEVVSPGSYYQLLVVSYLSPKSFKCLHLATPLLCPPGYQ